MTTHRSREEEAVLEVARQYARVSTMGCYIDDGSLVLLGGLDREHYTKYFAKQLLYKSKILLATMSTDEIEGKLIE